MIVLLQDGKGITKEDMVMEVMAREAMGMGDMDTEDMIIMGVDPTMATGVDTTRTITTTEITGVTVGCISCHSSEDLQHIKFVQVSEF